MVFSLQETTRMVLDFLQSKQYYKALISLEQESQVRLQSYGKEIDFFYDLVTEGKFEDVEKLIETVKERSTEAHDSILGLLRKQKFLESLEGSSIPEADELAQILKDIEVLMAPDEFETLYAILNYDHLTDHPKFANWTIWRGRYECFHDCYACLAELYAIETPAPVGTTLLEALSAVDREVSAETGSSSRMPQLAREQEGSGSSVVVNDSEELDTKKTVKWNVKSNTPAKEEQKRVYVEAIDLPSGSEGSPESEDAVIRKTAQELMLEFDPGKVWELARVTDGQAIRACGFDPSGDFCALGSNSSNLKVCSMQNIVAGVLYDQHRGRVQEVDVVIEVKNLHSGSLYCLDWSARGLQMATGSNDKTIRILTVPDLEAVLNEQTSPLVFTDGVDSDGEIDLQLRTITDLPGTIRTICFHPMDDELFFSSGTGSGEIMVWNTQTTQCVQRFAGHQGGTVGLAVAGDASFLQSVGRDGMIRLWDLRVYRCVQVINAENYGEMTAISLNCSAAITRAETKTHIAHLYSGAAAEKGRKVGQKLAAVSHLDGVVTVWDVSTGRLFSKHPLHKDSCRTVEFSSDKKWLTTASFDQSVGLVNLDTGESYRIKEHTGKVVNARWHPYLPVLLSTSTDRTARIFSI